MEGAITGTGDDEDEACISETDGQDRQCQGRVTSARMGAEALITAAGIAQTHCKRLVNIIASCRSAHDSSSKRAWKRLLRHDDKGRKETRHETSE